MYKLKLLCIGLTALILSGCYTWPQGSRAMVQTQDQQIADLNRQLNQALIDAGVMRARTQGLLIPATPQIGVQTSGVREPIIFNPPAATRQSFDATVGQPSLRASGTQTVVDGDLQAIIQRLVQAEVNRQLGVKQ